MRFRIAIASVAVLLAIGALSSAANACYEQVTLGQFTFPSYGSGYNSCLQQVAKTRLWLSDTESDLYAQYLNAYNGCSSAGNRQIQCVSGLSQHFDQSSINDVVRSLEQYIARCEQFFTRRYNEYKGNMCN